MWKNEPLDECACNDQYAIRGADLRTTITAQQLIDAGACGSAVRTFRELFGDSVGVTEDACVAVAELFDWDWAAEKLLTAPARVAYMQAKATASKAYMRAADQAWENYEKSKACEAYRQTMTRAWENFSQAKARAWCSAFLYTRGLLGAKL